MQSATADAIQPRRDVRMDKRLISDFKGTLLAWREPSVVVRNPGVPGCTSTAKCAAMKQMREHGRFGVRLRRWQWGEIPLPLSIK